MVFTAHGSPVFCGSSGDNGCAVTYPVTNGLSSDDGPHVFHPVIIILP